MSTPDPQYVDDYANPVKALAEAVALLQEIVDGDKLFDPGTDDEHESRENLLADYNAVLRRAKHIAYLQEGRK